MFKCYTIYLLLGIYVSLRSLETWMFRNWNDCNDVVTWLAIVSSVVLFFIAGPLLLYNSKLGIKTALTCLAGIMPFAVYWLTYIYQYEGFNKNGDNRLIFFAACVYSFSIYITVKHLNTSLPAFTRGKPFKIAFTFLPVVLSIALWIYNNW